MAESNLNPLIEHNIFFDLIKEDIRYYMQNKKRTDIVLTFNETTQLFKSSNKNEIGQEMKEFKKQQKRGELIIDNINNTTQFIDGVPLYIMVIQYTDTSRNPLCCTGLGFDQYLIVNGFIYSFKTEENRDSLYKYVMCI